MKGIKKSGTDLIFKQYTITSFSGNPSNNNGLYIPLDTNFPADLEPISISCVEIGFNGGQPLLSGVFLDGKTLYTRITSPAGQSVLKNATFLVTCVKKQ